MVTAVTLTAGLAVAQGQKKSGGKKAKDDAAAESSESKGESKSGESSADAKAAKGGGKQIAGNATKGKETFEQCAVCHNVDNPEKKMGPSLQGMYKRGKLSNGTKVTDQNVKAVINAGGNGMPAYADMLSEEEKNDLVAYIKTL